nr:MAG TPA: hypothetical protein [Caudoviricetes sp.]
MASFIFSFYWAGHFTQPQKIHRLSHYRWCAIIKSLSLSW